MKQKKVIAICASVSFYKDVLAIEKKLKKLGYAVKIPDTAKEMEKSGDFDASKHKTWYTNPADYTKKAKLMKDHFKKITKSDGVLIVNNEKNNTPGYIGGNTLMEISLAFHYKKPIFILNPIPENLAIKEEIYGVSPKILYGDVTKIDL